MLLNYFNLTFYYSFIVKEKQRIEQRGFNKQNEIYLLIISNFCNLNMNK